ncbi:hypothetical protein ACMFMG_006612 [Clarireedia jacksonii]
MNNPSNLSIYSQLLCFKSSTTQRTSIVLQDESQEELAQRLSRDLGISFSYCFETRKAILSRIPIEQSSELVGSDHDQVVHDIPQDHNDQTLLETNIDMSLYVTPPLNELSRSYQDVEIPAFDDSPMDLSEWPFADMDLDIEGTAFNDFSTGFSNIFSKEDGEAQLPDWSMLDEIISRHQYDPDTDMIDSSQLPNESDSMFLYGSFETSQSEETIHPSSVIHDPLPDIPEWGETSIESTEALQPSQPLFSSAVESPSEHRRPDGIDIVKKPSTSQTLSTSYQGNSSFQESVFSSTPARSSLQTYGSSPRRLGSLDSVTRAKGNAVKAIGACWRCKFLRKSCNTETRCSACPKGTHIGAWQSVGCKRGEIKDRMLPMPWCRRSNTSPPRTSGLAGTNQPWLYANHSHLDIIVRRKNELTSGIVGFNGTTKVDKFLKNLKIEKPLLTTLRIAEEPPLQRSRNAAAAVLKPLEECILATLWELLDCPLTQKALQPWTSLHDGTLDDFIVLLNAAAEYQATIGTNQLIAYTLTCLRTCIEALHVKETSPGSLEALSHQACEPSSCKVDCIRQIELQLEQYLDELSRVIFLKENLRSKTWWLSAFYSFCIQGVIRKALRFLCFKQGKNSATKEEEPAPKQYLHIAIRLFIASSGNYDPLSQDWSSEFAFSSRADGAPKASDYRAAQSALKQPIWKTHGIKSSTDYLRKLFEDPGTEPLLEPNDDKWLARLGPTNFTTLPEPYLPHEFTLTTCRKLRRDWDRARCSYTKEIVRIVKEHGHDSQVYIDTEEKWATVENLWRKFSSIAIANTVRDLGGKPGKGKGKEDYNLASVLKVFDGKDIQSSLHDHTVGHTSLRIPILPLPPRLEPLSADLADPAFVLTLRPQSQTQLTTTTTTRKKQNLYWPDYIRAPIPSKLPSLPSSSITSTSPLSTNMNLTPTNHSILSPSLLSPTYSFRLHSPKSRPESHLQEHQKEQGFCPYCPPPSRWLPLNGPYQDDMDFHHGVSSVTGRRVEEPVAVAVEVGVGEEKEGKEGAKQGVWGLCGRCGEWVGLGLGEGDVEGFGMSIRKEKEEKEEDRQEKDDEEGRQEKEEEGGGKQKGKEEGWFLHSFGCY